MNKSSNTDTLFEQNLCQWILILWFPNEVFFSFKNDVILWGFDFVGSDLRKTVAYNLHDQLNLEISVIKSFL